MNLNIPFRNLMEYIMTVVYITLTAEEFDAIFGGVL